MKRNVWVLGAGVGALVLLGAWGAARQPAVQPRLDRPRVAPATPVEPARVEPGVTQPAASNAPARTGWTGRPTEDEVDLPSPNRGMEPAGSGNWRNGVLRVQLASGPVRGSSTVRGREQTIEVLGLDHVVDGNQYGLVRVTIGADQSIPDLLASMGQSGQGATATIDLYDVGHGGVGSGTGLETKVFTIVLEGARVERVRLTRNMQFNEIGLGYDRITYRSVATGHEASAAR